MKIKYLNKTLINIPTIIENRDFYNISFRLNRNINYNEYNLLCNVGNINNLKIIISNQYKFNIINNYIYKYNLINYKKYNSYYLEEYNLIKNGLFEKKINSAMFILNLYDN